LGFLVMLVDALVSFLGCVIHVRLEACLLRSFRASNFGIQPPACSPQAQRPPLGIAAADPGALGGPGRCYTTIIIRSDTGLVTRAAF